LHCTTRVPTQLHGNRAQRRRNRALPPCDSPMPRSAGATLRKPEPVSTQSRRRRRHCGHRTGRRLPHRPPITATHARNASGAVVACACTCARRFGRRAGSTPHGTGRRGRALRGCARPAAAQRRHERGSCCGAQHTGFTVLKIENKPENDPSGAVRAATFPQQRPAFRSNAQHSAAPRAPAAAPRAPAAAPAAIDRRLRSGRHRTRTSAGDGRRERSLAAGPAARMHAPKCARDGTAPHSYLASGARMHAYQPEGKRRDRSVASNSGVRTRTHRIAGVGRQCVPEASATTARWRRIPVCRRALTES
jgi:hypothetical protein